MFRSNSKTHARMTRAMAKAVEAGDLKTVKKLISTHPGDTAFLNAVDKYGNTALLKSIRYGKVEIAEYLLTCKGIDVNQEAWEDKFEPREIYRCAPLNLAIKKGYFGLVKTMLRFPEINVNNYSFATALTVIDTAILWHRPEVVKLLLCHPRLDFKWLDQKKSNVFTWAYHHLCRASFNALITGPDVAVLSSQTISSGYYQTLDVSFDKRSSLLLLLKLPDFDVNSRLWEGDNLLMQAIKNDFDDLFAQTVACDSLKVNSVDDKGMSALHWAASLGKTKYVKALMVHDHINAYLQDEQDFTAVLWAAKNGHMGLAQLFLTDPHFKWHAKYRSGKNILMLAAEHQLETLVDLILRFNIIDVNARDDAGNTALMLAARSHDNTAITANLIEHGTDITLKNKSGCSAHDEANTAGHKKVKHQVRLRPVNEDEYLRFLLWKKKYPEAAAQLIPETFTPKI